ncbi:MAG: tetratricopeptide repeat protein [Armatimonadetes bacterium]|nr:tetratricopeptide repeat protein [Armatimonadota bacterium]
MGYGAAVPAASRPAPGGVANPFAHLSPRDLEPPPLPRQPLLSDNTRWLLSWLGVWLVVGLVIVGLVYVAKTAWDSARQGQATAAASSRFRTAQDAYDRGDYATARDEWLRAAEDANTPAEHREIVRRNAAIASVQLGAQYEKVGRRQDAERVYHQATAIYTYCGEAYTCLGRLASERGDYDSALSYYDQAIKVWNERLNVGGVPQEERQAMMSNREGALASKAMVLYNYGVRLMNQQRYSEADQKFAEVQMIAPSSQAAQLAQREQQHLPRGGGDLFPRYILPGL